MIIASIKPEGVGLHEDTVLERPGLRFVGVAHDVLRAVGSDADGSPFHRLRGTRPRPVLEARLATIFLDDGGCTHRKGERVAEGVESARAIGMVFLER